LRRESALLAPPTTRRLVELRNMELLLFGLLLECMHSTRMK
jgi:hypothetical protein